MIVFVFDGNAPTVFKHGNYKPLGTNLTTLPRININVNKEPGGQSSYGERLGKAPILGTSNFRFEKIIIYQHHINCKFSIMSFECHVHVTRAEIAVNAEQFKNHFKTFAVFFY